MEGFLSVLKPPGITSHEAVEYLRRLCGVRKVGHAGTLDPMACGVLPMAIGRATRLLEFLAGQSKSYRAEMLLGVTTTTQDLEGEVLSRQEVPPLRQELVREVLAQFLGGYRQVPPMYSALHYRGRRLYELARAGREVTRPARPVTIERLELLRLTPDGPYWRLLLDVRCGAGTYVRTLCADIGKRLGYGGCLAFLVRTGFGPFSLTASHTPEELRRAAEEGRLGAMVLPLDYPLSALPRAMVREAALPRVRHGQPVPETAVVWEAGNPPPGAGPVRLYEPQGRLVAIALYTKDAQLVMRKVFGQEEDD
ncbi:MAG: tRNA pseudouridine(55) synthase TruB [Clostridia bacterium]|nr:tRNA pseudouridine(55) synthase TruB [Clostridia bacterium]